MCVGVPPSLQMSFQVQHGSSKLPQKFYTGEVDAFWRNDTSFEESRLHYLDELHKLRKVQEAKKNNKPFRDKTVLIEQSTMPEQLMVKGTT